MPTAAYTAWLAKDTATRVVLAEIQPAEILAGWAATGGGHANVYQVAWASQAQTAAVPGGVYRRLDGVRQNDTSLTSRASLAALDAAAEGYFFDDAASQLYVKTTTGVNPATFAALLAFFTIFVATEPIADAVLYEPRLSSELPQIELTSDDPLFGIKQSFSGSVRLTNTDRLFDALVRKWVWKNKVVTLKFGGTELALSDYETVAVMKVEDATPNDDFFELKLRQMASILDRRLPLNTFTSTEYTHLASGLEGSYKPLLYGKKTNIPGLCVDTTVSANVYLVADASAQVLTAVSAVRAKNKSTGVTTNLALGGDYSVNLAACTVTVTNPAYDQGAYDVLIDATGETDGAGSYLRTCGEIVQDLLLNLGELPANIDSAAFAQADIDCTFDLALWMRDAKGAGEYVRLLEQSVLGALFIGRDGRWTFKVWDPGYDVATTPTLVDEDIASWGVDDKLETIFPTARVTYDPNPATGEKKETTSTDAAVRYAYETTETVTIETALASATDAQVTAQRYRLLAGSPTVNVQVEERGITQMTAQPFDKVLVTRARAPHESGSYVAQVMEILRAKKNLAPATVELLLGDLRGFGDRVGRWADTSAPDYASATAEERVRDGYWTDSDGYIVPGDVSTKDQSIWY